MLKEFYKEMCPPLFLKTFALLSSHAKLITQIKN